MQSVMNMPGRVLLYYALALSVSCAAAASLEPDSPPNPGEASRHTGLAAKAPPGVLHLYPSVFVPPDVLDLLHARSGDVVLVEVPGAARQAWIYAAPMAPDSIGVHPWLRDTLGVEPGSDPVTLGRARGPSFEPRPIEPWMEAYPGNSGEWPGIAVGAPHGDCDLYTGEIVRRMTEISGLPTAAAYGYRISGLGRWIDVNRPLGKPPRPRGGVYRERALWEEPLAVYHEWQELVRETAQLEAGQPFRFYCSFHGHDLTIRHKDGDRVERRVVEAMGSGFTPAELNTIKDWYYELAGRCFDDPPLIVFGNLPEDRIYEVDGVEARFFYSGFGARKYGTLRRDRAERALHLETPNVMRFQPEHRESTAHIFAELFRMIRDSLLVEDALSGELLPAPKGHEAPSGMIELPGGGFKMGAPEGRGWSCERPQHQVALPPYRIQVREVTHAEFAAFLQHRLEEDELLVGGGLVRERRAPDRVLAALAPGVPLSDFLLEEGRIQAREGRGSFPAVYVSWFGARAYAKWIGARLPSEAEWEMAAVWDPRGGDHAHAGENTTARETINCDHSGDPWENGPYPRTWPAGLQSGRADAYSPAGCLDLLGNAAEWCADWYSFGYYREDPPAEDPRGPGSGTLRSCRGGSWAQERATSTTSFRIGLDPGGVYPDVGFRCAQDVSRNPEDAGR